MAVWLVRAGKSGDTEQTAIEKSVVTIAWNELPDLSSISDRESLATLYRRIFPDASGGKVANHVGQIWAFRSRIQKDDLVVLPLKRRSAIAIGKMIGPYQYTTEMGDGIRHIRKVEWLRTDLPRTTFEQDILHSLGAFMTVCQIERNHAEERIRSILGGKKAVLESLTTGDELEDDSRTLDVDEVAGDQIIDHIQRRFSGHKLATLVDAVLKAEGYLTRVSPPGPDGGVDILAGTGPMGFGPPHLCVQAKSSSSPADVNVLRGLQGILKNFDADQGTAGLLGRVQDIGDPRSPTKFLHDTAMEFRRSFGNDPEELRQVPDDLRAELPLKRVWALVLEE